MVKEVFYVRVISKHGANIGHKQFNKFPSEKDIFETIVEFKGYQATIDKRYVLLGN